MGFRFGNWIYWRLTDPWLQVIITVSLIHAPCSSLGHTLKSSKLAVFISRCSVAASNGGLFPSPWFPNCPMPRLPHSNSNSAQRQNLSSPPTNSSHFTNSQAGGHLTRTSYSSHCRLKTKKSNGSWPSLYSIGTDHTENTASSSSSVIACVSVAAITYQRLFYSCLFRSRCLATSQHAAVYLLLGSKLV
jgi:hypothetical protein